MIQDNNKDQEYLCDSKYDVYTDIYKNYNNNNYNNNKKNKRLMIILLFFASQIILLLSLSALPGYKSTFVNTLCITATQTCDTTNNCILQYYYCDLEYENIFNAWSKVNKLNYLDKIKYILSYDTLYSNTSFNYFNCLLSTLFYGILIISSIFALIIIKNIK
jgi:hypothetical protein